MVIPVLADLARGSHVAFDGSETHELALVPPKGRRIVGSEEASAEDPSVVALIAAGFDCTEERCKVSGEMRVSTAQDGRQSGCSSGKFDEPTARAERLKRAAQC